MHNEAIRREDGRPLQGRSASGHGEMVSITSGLRLPFQRRGMMKPSISASFVVGLLLWSCAATLSAQASRPAGATTFTVRIENIARRVLVLPNGREADIPLSAGVWVLHTGRNPIFTPGELAAPALKALAEAGMAAAYAPTLRGADGVRATSTFETPQGRPRGAMSTRRDEGGGAHVSRMLAAGQHFEFTFTAQPGDRLSVAVMVAQSNDGLLATDGEGLALFDPSGRPVSGEITGRFTFWDVGTEVNEQPGMGRNQGLRQGAAHAGDPEQRPVRRMADAEFGELWPAVARIVRVTITPRK
jgi:hypothetical protein